MWRRVVCSTTTAFIIVSSFFLFERGDGFVIIEPKKSFSKLCSKEDEEVETKPRKRDMIKSFLRNIASLSLKDYTWRSDVFKSNEADRMMEESLAIMRGKEASYVRPMHARNLGPLGRAEKEAVTWLSDVIEEEGTRAKRISENGTLVRPMEMEKGRLAALEKDAVSFVQQIIDSETERVVSGTKRPMELAEEKRGPLGQWEANVTGMWRELAESEKTRNALQSRSQYVVRPMDVPGPLGEIERVWVDVASAEKQRVNQGKLRPKEVSKPSLLGQAERELETALTTLRDEESLRFQSLKHYLQEKRPMELDRESPLGFTEALFVNIMRGPGLLLRVFQRVNELLKSETIEPLPSNTTLSETKSKIYELE